MEDIKLSWEDFERIIDDENKRLEEQKKESKFYISDLLFRGHSKREWKLETTLERYKRKNNISQEFTWKNYHAVLLRLVPAISSYTNNKYEVEDFAKRTSWKVPPSYDFMVYLRHHGFPSPLLDWTRSHYIAAFFAFEEAEETDEVAIYCYREYVDRGKTSVVTEPTITGLGPYVKTHRRHHLQQCQYTICVKKNEENDIYCSHEEADFREDQDFLRKFVISGTEKNKVLRKLFSMNINAYSLFGSEESLMKMLAYKELPNV